MRTAALAIALLMSGAAIAQTGTYTTTTTQPELDVDADVGVQPDGDLDIDADVDVDNETTTTTTTVTPHGTATHSTTTEGTMTTQGTTTTLATNLAPASGAIVQPSNADPEHDARGIAVISDPAAVPAGFNGVTSPAVGGPLADPATGQAIVAADASYPACTANETDNCVQTYERGVDPQ